MNICTGCPALIVLVNCLKMKKIIAQSKVPTLSFAENNSPH